MPPPSPAPSPGLRERKKRRLRHELSLAALRLAKERGVDNVRTEDIVAAVGVSRRTFSNYFANKYEAIADRGVERAHASAVVLAGRPPAEPLWQALTAALLAPYEPLVFSDSPESREATRFVFTDPLVRAELWKGGEASREALTRAIAARTGLDPETELYPGLVAATALTVVTTVLEHWLRLSRPPPLVPMLRDALDLIARGLPVPEDE